MLAATILVALLVSTSTSLHVSFEPPTVVHKSYNLQHAWFSSLAPLPSSSTNNDNPANDNLLLSFSLGGDGTPCPPPGKPKSFQNCSMTQLSHDGGLTWRPLPDWSKHSFNEIVPLKNSFLSLGYGTKKVKQTKNMTAVQYGWEGHIDATTGDLVVDHGFNVTYTTTIHKFPDVLVRSGSVVQTSSGSYITTLYGHGDGIYRHWTQHPIVFVVESKNLKDWNVISEIPWHPSYGNFSDGPGEPSTTRLTDDRLLMIIRINGDTPYWKSYSSDNGVTWSTPIEMISVNGVGQWSVKPRIRSVPGTNILILCGGRPGLFLWISENLGDSWTTFNIAKIHNDHLPVMSSTYPLSSELMYTASVVNCTNWTDARATPPATSSYFGVAFTQTGQLVISYDRLSNGWHGASPQGAWGSFDAMFTMRVTITEEEEEVGGIIKD